MANFKTLTKWHVFLGILSLILFGIPNFLAGDNITEAGKFYLPLMNVLFPLLHFSIAYGCNIQSEFGRLASRTYGILLMPFVPFGTIIGFILFENTKKKFQLQDA